MLTATTRATSSHRLALWGWLALAALLILAGFALDPVTATGHHLLLIAGGITTGSGLARHRKR